MRNPANDVEKRMKRLRKWLADSRESLVEDCRRDIELRLTQNEWGLVAISVGCYGSWLGGQGVIEELHRDPHGWQTINGSIRCWWWEARILNALKVVGQNRYGPARQWLARLMAYGLATGDNPLPQWSGDLLYKSLEQRRQRDREEWGLSPFPMFMVELYAKRQQLVHDFTQYDFRSLGVYQAVFDAWDDVAAIGAAIQKACDYHVRRSDGEGVGLEFVYNPFGELPAEILAIYKVRESLGLSTPPVEHPLLDTPLAHPPSEIPEYRDKWLDLIAEKFREAFPDQ